MSQGRVTVEGVRRRVGAYSERELAATLLGAIALAGPLVGILTYPFPHPAGTDYLAPTIAFVVSIVAGAIVWRRRAKVGWGTIALVAALGSLVITVVMLSVPDRTGAYASYYVWLGIFSFYFLRPAWALLEVAWIAVLYGAAVAIDAPPGSIEQWINGVATTLGVGLIVLALKTRIGVLLSSLEDAALTDDLTGLPNRRAFDAQLERELQRSIRGGRELALAILDLDRFKELNDTAGHLEGDDALERVASVIDGELRAMDSVARIGGDEFAILLPEVDGPEAERVAGRLRSAIEVAFAEATVPLSASLGLSVRDGRDLTATGLLDEADRALYAAKRRGGARVARPGGADRAGSAEPIAVG